ncbi:MAG: hypothetical protein RMJ43_04970, partial [Chloroherpetonaceae bacterium]|nr:hypothetical protein [Chloroherpetonaceae bacterium]
VGMGRGHLQGTGGAGDAADQFAAVGVSGHDGTASGGEGAGGALPGVESEGGHAGAGVRAVAGKAVLRQNRANVPVKVDLRRSRCCGRQRWRSCRERYD